MERELFITADGSPSIRVPALGETYHSAHGALTESRYVFIENGLLACSENPLVVLEVGFGTGLNASLTVLEAQKNQIRIAYFGVEKYPLQPDEFRRLELSQTDTLLHTVCQTLHTCPWDQEYVFSDAFRITKIQADIRTANLPSSVNLIYFDAFAPDKQPGLWTPELFQRLHKTLAPGGILVTYSAKGQVRRDLIMTGFHVDRLPGPPGKREMLRARKI